MHFLIACSECRRQFDVAARPVGERFQCSCGASVTVPQPRTHDAAVIRCSSCGAPREESARACRYCNADFTLHERDLDTICSRCMARVSGKAHFCHSCGTPVLVRQAAAAGCELPCPSCADGRRLGSRQLGATNVAMFECDTCGGIWIEKEVFEILAERARAQSLPDLDLRPAERKSAGGAPQKGPFYRPCVVCKATMNRRNWGKRSGIILDVCQKHGVWFDLHELEDLLRFLRTDAGRQSQNAAEAERAALRQLAIQGSLRSFGAPAPSSPGSLAGALAAGFLAGVLGDLFS
ncbi:MAG TPA: zf-TFIIB domain-containing protein [Thermoanaerobaculia bacterium]|nr:zf-TFIIB domain-containing protein [Thermoanaerobaculia bacterium]